MSPYELATPFATGTSAGSPMVHDFLHQQVPDIAEIAIPRPSDDLDVFLEEQKLEKFLQTNSGIKVVSAQSSSTAIMALRRRSGLTWQQLASLFNVRVRSLHLWASGGRLNSLNQDKLSRILAILLEIDSGSAKTNRNMLLTPETDGVIPFDLLREGEYNEAHRRLLQGPKTYTEAPKDINSRLKEQHISPTILANARQDTLHKGTGKTRRPKRALATRKSNGNKRKSKK